MRLCTLVAVVSILLAAGCNIGGDKAFEVGTLQVVPNPAQAGDVVSFNFFLLMVPERSFTVTALIDNTVHGSQALRQLYDGSFEFLVGDAEDLITQYGLGSHEGRIEVTITGESTVLTTSSNFELQEVSPSPTAQSPVMQTPAVEAGARPRRSQGSQKDQ